MAEGRAAVERAIEDFIGDYSDDLLVVVVVVFASPPELRYWVHGKKEYASAAALTLVDVLRTTENHMPTYGPFERAVRESAKPESRRAPTSVDMEDAGDGIRIFSEAAAEIFDGTGEIVTRWLVATEYTEEETGERLVEWSGPLAAVAIDPFPIISIFYIFWLESGGFTIDTLRNQFVLSDVARDELENMLAQMN